MAAPNPTASATGVILELDTNSLRLMPDASFEFKPTERPDAATP